MYMAPAHRLAARPGFCMMETERGDIVNMRDARAAGDPERGWRKMAAYEWISTIIGITQCGLIGYGLRAMRLASEIRDREGARRHAESMAAFEKSEQESARCHTETMAALDKRHTELMTVLEKRHDQWMETFEERNKDSDRRHAESMTALKALIERTDRTKA